MDTAQSIKRILGEIPKTPRSLHSTTLTPNSNDLGLIILQNNVLNFEYKLQQLLKSHPRVVVTVQIWPERIESEVSIRETERYQTLMIKLNESRKKLIRHIINNTVIENHFDSLRTLTREVSRYEQEERENTQREREEWLKSPAGIQITAQNEAIMKAREEDACYRRKRQRRNANMISELAQRTMGQVHVVDDVDDVFSSDSPLHHVNSASRVRFRTPKQDSPKQDLPSGNDFFGEECVVDNNRLSWCEENDEISQFAITQAVADGLVV